MTETTTLRPCRWFSLCYGSIHKQDIIYRKNGNKSRTFSHSSHRLFSEQYFSVTQVQEVARHATLTTPPLTRETD